MIDIRRGYWIAVHDPEKSGPVLRFHATYDELMESFATPDGYYAPPDLIEVIERRADGGTTRHRIGTVWQWCCDRLGDRDAEHAHSEGRRTAQARGR